MNSIFASRVNEFIPKYKIILFNSYPDVSGNSLALYKYIVCNRNDIKNKYKLIWTVGDMTKEKARSKLSMVTIEQKHIVLKKKSIIGVVAYFFSKFIISTHGYFPGIKTSSKQLHINLWHGMPFKCIGRLLNEDFHTNGKRDEADITIATSKLYQKVMAKAFEISEDKVIITGQPCTDLLVTPTNSLGKLGIHTSKFKKLIVWMPTYRKSILGDIRNDGNEKAFGVTDVVLKHFSEFDSLLKKFGYCMVVKLHPMDVISKIELPESDNIRIIKNADLEEANIELYDMLSNADLLLTDYSSVFIDFLITNKPIAFVCDDLNDYGESRGFCFNPPQDYMPGELISNYEELTAYLQHVDEINQLWKNKYDYIKALFYPFSDDKSCERVCKALSL